MDIIPCIYCGAGELNFQTLFALNSGFESPCVQRELNTASFRLMVLGASGFQVMLVRLPVTCRVLDVVQSFEVQLSKYDTVLLSDCIIPLMQMYEDS